MFVKEFKNIFKKDLLPFYDEQEIDSFFFLTLENLHQMKRLDLALQPNFYIEKNEIQQWEQVVEELKVYKPIQYILGATEFCGLPFLVNENVLIPRPETEELVELIVKDCELLPYTLAPNSKLKILDIGTGSGCIPIALKKFLPNAEVFAIDISDKALEVAKKNAIANQVTINFIQADILKVYDLQNFSTPNFPLSTSFDIIVSNPPYVRMLEKTEISPNVLEYEPHLALFVEDNDALLFYRKIANLAKNSLKPNGKLYFEINQYLGKETLALVESYGFKNCELHKDIYGNDRMIKCNI
ncbi:peptide chain release factor N(5)-glutamine methyltransferase [Flavobacterium sp. j3]|uniref:Release factor glutamine methyltransferase n=1 Tax=Flavobacterium aureirubrum TaxID=3133147 RepID=A0ABU9N086_9FLAO